MGTDRERVVDRGRGRDEGDGSVWNGESRVTRANAHAREGARGGRNFGERGDAGVDVDGDESRAAAGRGDSRGRGECAGAAAAGAGGGGARHGVFGIGGEYS